jgi:hypothetical protein
VRLRLRGEGGAAPHPPAGTFSRKNGEKFDFIDDFANRQRLDIRAGVADSKLLPVLLHGEKVPTGG